MKTEREITVTHDLLGFILLGKVDPSVITGWGQTQHDTAEIIAATLCWVLDHDQEKPNAAQRFLSIIVRDLKRAGWEWSLPP